MKFEIKASRPETYCSWSATLNRKHVTACNEDVDKLFDGVRSALKCTFEISNRRPRHDDYHTFIWRGNMYKASEITKGYTPCVTTYVSECIMKVFRRNAEKSDPIFVTVY